MLYYVYYEYIENLDLEVVAETFVERCIFQVSVRREIKTRKKGFKFVDWVLPWPEFSAILGGAAEEHWCNSTYMVVRLSNISTKTA